MGIAIIIPNVDFSAKNLGQVTFQEDAPVTSVAINAQESYEGINVQPSVSYTPGTTNQKGVTWSITSGSEYATINPTTGLVTILEGASGTSVTIKATSTYDSTIVATKTISVTYKETVDILTSLSIDGKDTVSGISAQYSVLYTPVNTSLRGGTWSIDSGSNYAKINESTGQVTINPSANLSNVIIRFTSSSNPTIFATKSLTLTYAEPLIDFSNKVGYIPLPLCGSDYTVYIKFKYPITDGGVEKVHCNIISDTPYNISDTWDKVSKSGAFAVVPYYGFGRHFKIITHSGGANSTAGNTYNLYDKDNGASGSTSEVLFNYDTAIIDNNQITPSTYDFKFNVPNPYLYINIGGKTSKYIEKMSSDELTAEISNGTIIPNYQTLVFEKLIIFHNTKYTTVAEVLANRASADIDLCVENGKITNNGTSGEVIYG